MRWQQRREENLHRRSRRERRKTGGKGEEGEGKPHKHKVREEPCAQDKTIEDQENSGNTLGDLMN